MAEIARLTRYQLRWIYFPERDEDQKPQPRLKPGQTPAFRPKCYKDMFWYVWKVIRKVPKEEVQKRWDEYVADCEKRGQPVNPRTGRPLWRYTEFDPLPSDEAKDQEQDEEQLEPVAVGAAAEEQPGTEPEEPARQWRGAPPKVTDADRNPRQDDPGRSAEHPEADGGRRWRGG